ncbi:MAG TPA: protein kinase, partial [Pirellulales bacterium]|nr:protein kinase [Pirellulales bacterium]
MSDSLGPAQNDDSQRRIETIAEEFLDELQAGGHPDPANIVAAHPELAGPLKRRLALVERLFRAGQNANTNGRSMPAERAHRLKCPHCGNRIQWVEPRPKEVTCVNCGSSFRVEPEGTATFRTSGVQGRIGRFQVLELLGRGAFGEVYKARDSELDRLVALKIPRTDSFATPEEEQRFLREARSAAGLRHPSIVQVHEISQEHGSPYIVSDYIEGLTLADLMSGGRPAFRESAQLVAQLADAIDYAHRQKIIHRDIKPSNILLGTAMKERSGSGGSTAFTPFLTDFGLARRDEGEITVTLDGQVLGTPAYMSPEQAAGDHAQVDGRSDVYSLGVVLYELICGELPFRGSRRMLLHQVLHDEPRPPRTFNDKIPRDLETICLKAMAKEPARRYGTAAELALDLRRWLNLEPIHARPVSAGERLWRWCRRRPAQAALVAASVVAVIALVGIGVALTFNFRLQAAADEAEHQRGIAMVKKNEAEQAQAESERQREEAQRQRALADELGLKARRYWYAADIALAWQAWSDGDVARMREFLDRQRPNDGDADLRDFEWRHLWTLCHRERHELVDGASCLTAVAFSADGGTLATGSSGVVTLRDPASGEARHTFSGLGIWIQGLAFSPDSMALAAVGGTTPEEPGRVYLWDLKTRELKHVFSEHTGYIRGVAFSPDGAVLATASDDKTVRLW